MATGADLLNAMSDLNDELEPTSGGADHTRALRALNRSQDWLETELAQIRNAYGSYTTVTTAADTETVALPTGYIRIDRLQYIDPDTSRPTYTLHEFDSVGDISVQRDYLSPLFASSSEISGKPFYYSIFGNNFHFDPIPDGTHTIRVYGFAAADDITNASTFAYGDQFIWPIASVAVRMFRQRLEDSQVEIAQFAAECFRPALDQLAKRSNDGALYPRYEFAYTV